MDHCLKQLKKLVANDDVLSKDHFHDEYLSLFILSNDFKTKHSFNALKSYYVAKKTHPEFFWPPTELIKLFYDNFPCSWLSPATTPSINLLIVSFHKWDSEDSNIKLVHFLSSIVVSLQIKLLMNPFKVSKGVNIIFDFEHFNWKHFQEVDVLPLRKLLQFIDESLPIKLIRIICINMNRVSKTLMALIKPFVGGNIRRKLVIIDSNRLIDPDEDESNQYSKLHAMISPTNLPVDFNGFYSVINVLTANLINDLIRYESSILNHWNKDLMAVVPPKRTLVVVREETRVEIEKEVDLNNNNNSK